MNRYYRFQLSAGYLTHLWKSATRQDHSEFKNIICRYLPENGVAIDVGAHGGQFTRLLSGIAKTGLIVAVEPSGYTRSVLRPALWLRGCRNVIIVAAALGARPGAMLIRTPIKPRGDMGYGLANLVDGGAQSITEPVAVLTLDNLVAQLELNRVDFIKADIEGFEAELIKGAREILAKFRPAVLLEMDDSFLRRAGSSFAALWDDMAAQGYIAHTGQGVEISNAQQPVEGDILWLPAT